MCTSILMSQCSFILCLEIVLKTIDISHLGLQHKMTILYSLRICRRKFISPEGWRNGPLFWPWFSTKCSPFHPWISCVYKAVKNQHFTYGSSLAEIWGVGSWYQVDMNTTISRINQWGGGGMHGWRRIYACANITLPFYIWKKTVGSAEHKIGRWGTASKVFCKCQIWVATVHVLNTLFLYLGKHSGSLAWTWNIG